MADYEQAIRGIVEPLIEHKESLMVRTLPGASRKDVTVLICAEDDDTARLIGRQGAVASALREVVGIASKADNSNTRIHLKFESFSEGKEEEGE